MATTLVNEDSCKERAEHGEEVQEVQEVQEQHQQQELGPEVGQEQGQDDVFGYGDGEFKIPPGCLTEGTLEMGHQNVKKSQRDFSR